MILRTRRAVIGGLATVSLLRAMPSRAQSAPIPPALTERIKDGKLIIGIHNRAPWGFRAEDGSVAGYEPDLVRLAFTPLGVKDFEFVVTEFGALIPGLQAHRFDMVASGVAVTPARCQQVIFSEPDLLVVDAVLVKKGNPLNIHSFKDMGANPKFRMAGGRGDLNTQDAIKGGIAESQVTYFPTDQESVSALLADRADGMVDSAPSAMTLLKDPKLSGLERATPFTGLTRPDGSPVGLVTAVAFRREDGVLRDAYNAQLAALRADGTVKKIMARYGFSEGDIAPARTTANICAG